MMSNKIMKIHIIILQSLQVYKLINIDYLMRSQIKIMYTEKSTATANSKNRIGKFFKSYNKYRNKKIRNNLNIIFKTDIFV